MESIVNFACANAHSAHWIFFLLLLLAGFNLPISEDVILLTGGAIASLCIPEEKLHLYFWIYAGCWISAWEAYGIGRYLGPRLYDVRWFRHIITPERIKRLHHYYEKFGVFTFIVGRFIPGGVRNALFMTAGLGKMPFWKFILRDGIACLISTSIIFSIGYTFAANYKTIVHNIQKSSELFTSLLVVIVLIVVVVVVLKRKKKAAG